MTKKVKTGILMLNMGGPATLPEVGPFLQRLFGDPEIFQAPFQPISGPLLARARTKHVTELYRSIGGGSPILKWTDLQGEGMAKRLDKLSPETAPHKHYVGFRYTQPFTEGALQAMKKDGVERAVAFSQYPQFCCATTGASFNELWRETKRLGMDDAFKWSLIDRWWSHPGFIRSVHNRIQEGLGKYSVEDRNDVIILFSAHSLPIPRVNRGDMYAVQIGATIEKVMESLNYSNQYLLSYQSAVGPVAWLGPRTDEMITSLGEKGRKNVMVVPIAFTSDHIETLSEIDDDFAGQAEKAGVTGFSRTESLNDAPYFIDALADIVNDHIKSNKPHTRTYELSCPQCSGKGHCRNIMNPASQLEPFHI